MKTVLIKEFGKDHWSLLAYCEYRGINRQSVLDKTHLRCKHPVINSTMLGQNLWKPEFGTRLKGFFLEGDKRDKTKLLSNHDDYDCLDDLEAAELIKNVGTMINPYAELTKKGQEVAALLNIHKQKGGYFANFNYEKTKK